MKKRKEDNQTKIYLIISGVLLLIILIYSISLLTNNDNILLDSSKSIVYTTYQNTEYNQEIPQVNIKKVSDTINSQILDFTNNYKDIETNSIKYDYEVNGNVLSLIVIIENYEIEGPADMKFLSFAVDLKKKKILTNEELVNLFNYTENQIVDMINKSLLYYYNDELNKKIIKNISYEEYLSIHKITDLKKQLYYYVKDGKLNVYLDFQEWASEETENYFVDKSYIFEIN